MTPASAAVNAMNPPTARPAANDGLESNLHAAYSALLAKEIVVDEELRTLDAWLSEVG